MRFQKGKSFLFFYAPSALSLSLIVACSGTPTGDPESQSFSSLSTQLPSSADYYSQLSPAVSGRLPVVVSAAPSIPHAAKPTLITNVQAFGAKGDGVTDDTSAFQAAIESGQTVLIPHTAQGYRILGPLSIRKPVTVLGSQNVVLRSGSETVFWIASPDVSISGLTLNMSASRAGTVAFYLDTAATSLERISISDVEVQNAYHSVKDAAHPSQIIVNLHLNRMKMNGARGTQIMLRDAFAFIYVQEVQIQKADPNGAFPVVYVDDNEGSIWTQVSVQSDHPSVALESAPGFYFHNARAVWMSSVSSKRNPGAGIVFENSTYLYLHGFQSSQNQTGGLVFRNSGFISAFGIVSEGRVGQGSAQPSADGLTFANVKHSQFSLVDTRNNTGHGLHVGGSSENTFHHITAANNTGFGAVDSTSGSSNILRDLQWANNASGTYSWAGSYEQAAMPVQPDLALGSAVQDPFLLQDPRALLFSQRVVNVLDFGAKGDGVTDDTGAFNQAASVGGIVIVPNTATGYKINGSIIIRNPVHFIGIGKPQLLSGSETLFWVASSQFTISDFILKMNPTLSRPGTAAIYLDTTSSSLHRIRLSRLSIFNAYHAIRDGNDPKNSLSLLGIFDVTMRNSRGSQVLLADAISGIYLRKVIVDHVGNKGLIDYPSIRITNSQGLVLEDTHVLAKGDSPSSATSAGFHILNSQNVWVVRSMADTTGGTGFWFDDSRSVHLSGPVASLNDIHGFVFARCSEVNAINLATGGRNYPGLSQGPGGYGIYLHTSAPTRMTNVSTRYHTVGSAVVNSNANLFDNFQSFGNQN